ncbi:MAG: ABC transporter ATP-binding protein [Chloroflexi bacterium]|nr:MAG: ABC transporter ATP-binding protein [Chloroflexota bacterium]
MLSADRRVILQLEGVSKVYGSGELAVTALREATFRVYGGEIVAVMGPSGSGKTTLLTIAGALLRPTKGRVTICGVDVTAMNESHLAAIRRERIGFVYQSFNLLEALTALENVRVVLQNNRTNGKAPALERARDILEVFGLGHRINSLPKKMSDGEKQRVAIARALAKDPELILADEPTANLDAKRGHEVMDLLRQKALELRKAVVVVSHDNRIREFAQRIVWLEDGRLHEDSATPLV